MRQQVVEPARVRRSSTVKYGPAPHSGNCSSSGWRVAVDRVAERLEQPPQEALAAAAGEHGQRGPSAAAAARPAPAGPCSCPRSAEPNTCAMATLRNEDAAYGRSLTYWPRKPSAGRRAADQADRVHVEQQRGRAAVGVGLGVEDVGRAEPRSNACARAGFLWSRYPRSVAGRVRSW